jgi:hypothetical protein
MTAGAVRCRRRPHDSRQCRRNEMHRVFFEKMRSAKLGPIAGVFCAIAVVFYCAYTRSYDGMGLVILLVFFTYFLNLKSRERSRAAVLSPTSGSASRSPVRELAKGLACIAGGALGVGIGLKIPDVQMGSRDRVVCRGGWNRGFHALSTACIECIAFRWRQSELRCAICQLLLVFVAQVCLGDNAVSQIESHRLGKAELQSWIAQAFKAGMPLTFKSNEGEGLCCDVGSITLEIHRGHSVTITVNEFAGVEFSLPYTIEADGKISLASKSAYPVPALQAINVRDVYVYRYGTSVYMSRDSDVNPDFAKRQHSI